MTLAGTNQVGPERPLSAEDIRGDFVQAGHRLFGIVWVNPERMGGVPCFAGTRVPVKTLFDYLEAGETVNDFLEGFPGVTRGQALAVIDVAGAGLIDELVRR